MSAEITPQTLLLNALRRHDAVVIRADAITAGDHRGHQPTLAPDTDRDAFVILSPVRNRATSWDADIRIETIVAPGVAADGTALPGAWVETIVGAHALTMTTGSLHIFDEGRTTASDRRPFLDTRIGVSELAVGASDLHEEARDCATQLGAGDTTVVLDEHDDAIAV